MVDAPAVLVDTNAIIEAVRTGCWAAITGRWTVETVQECYEEALRGDSTRPSYVRVATEDLDRLNTVHRVTELGHSSQAVEASSLVRSFLRVEHSPSRPAMVPPTHRGQICKRPSPLLPGARNER